MQHQVKYISISIISFVLFIVLTFFVYTKNASIFFINEAANTLLQKITDINYFTFWRVVTTFGGEVALPLITACTAAYVYKTKKDRNSVFEYIVAMTLGAILVIFFKNLVELMRPGSLYAIETSYSYPSGHTALATIFSLFSSHVFLKDKITLHKYIIYLLSFSFICLIGFSRIALGEHWFFDVVGGFLLGLFVTSITIFLFEKKS